MSTAVSYLGCTSALHFADGLNNLQSVGALHSEIIASWWVVAQSGPITTTNITCGVLVPGHVKRIETNISTKRPEKQALRLQR